DSYSPELHLSPIGKTLRDTLCISRGSWPSLSTRCHAHGVARLADFIAIRHGTSGVFEFAFAGRGVDRRRAEKEPDFLWRLVAFALAIQIDPGNAAAGFAERNRDKVSGLARATELGLVIRGLEFPGVYFEFLADVGTEFRLGFDSFHARDRKSTRQLQSPDHLVCRLLLEK